MFKLLLTFSYRTQDRKASESTTVLLLISSISLRSLRPSISAAETAAVVCILKRNKRAEEQETFTFCADNTTN